MQIFTIGFTKKSAKSFFELLRLNKVKTVLDVRLNNNSQLAGFAKGNDLRFFLTDFCDIKYIHDKDFAPTKVLLDDYKNKKITWAQYEVIFSELLLERKIKKKIEGKYISILDNLCILCSEAIAEKCHRRLVAEYIKNSFPELKIQIKHLE